MSEDKWEIRDRKRVELEELMVAKKEASRQKYISLIEKALNEADWSNGMDGIDIATAAIDALLDEGVVFAYLVPWDES